MAKSKVEIAPANQRLIIRASLAEKRAQLVEFYRMTGDPVFKEYEKGFAAAIKLLAMQEEKLAEKENGCACGGECGCK